MIDRMRIDESRQRAVRARREAERAPSEEVRQSFLSLADGWNALADQIEANERVLSHLGSIQSRELRRSAI